MTTDTNTLSYWLNWRFLLCALFLSIVMVVAALLIWKYEGFKRRKSGSREDSQDSVGSLYEDELWRTCLKGIHPVWLLAYRMLAFAVLFGLILSEAVVSGGGIFLFYTQWTFTLVTLYFGLATSFSIYGCCRKCNDSGSSTEHTNLDAERGSYVPPTLGVESPDVANTAKSLNSHEYFHTRKAAGVGGYAFQIIFQRYPFFRIGYFVLWTGIFVIFQWILHACVSMPWPYPFLDLSPPSAPLWYAGVGLMNVPCFGVFALVIKMKQSLLPKLFPRSFQESS
ncbi:uncharacterized protein LOC120075696 isoform X4 [Benincasa hispida]|uniref:uncharacterized protein LOC120075696 isoform X4 n=1 Tax=Benincasa hispida TaxID=102211 RepID=UPI0018FF6796|nr:uncharacterized protein LOC120075696 isoform X4 [Benincasa hispida]